MCTSSNNDGFGSFNVDSVLYVDDRAYWVRICTGMMVMVFLVCFACGFLLSNLFGDANAAISATLRDATCHENNGGKI